jgi:leucyl aminopeptidase
LGRLGATWLSVVGLGDGTGAAAIDGVRRAAGAAGKAARARGVGAVALSVPNLDATGSAAAVEGFSAGNYKFDRYKAEGDRKAGATSLDLLGGDAAQLDVAKALAAGQTLARDLVNEPAAVIYPESLADQARALRDLGLEVTVWDHKKLKKNGMGGITAVGQGSKRKPRFIHLSWTPENPTRKVALIGKGVTFDAGGLSIKPSSGMQTMRCDMGGSATVLGVMRAVGMLKPDVEVHGVIGAAENMLGGNAFKLGDVLTMYNGKTVEIHNTDAEGRLCLADCLAYASKLGVDEMVDIATLTGAAVVALGEHYTALMSQNDDLADRLLSHADHAGEGLWRLPLPDFYKEKLKAEWGTLKNVGGRAAGSITAGLFLSEFVDGPDWAHLDIAGPAFLDKPRRQYASGGTGAMVPTLTRWVLGG